MKSKQALITATREAKQSALDKANMLEPNDENRDKIKRYRAIADRCDAEIKVLKGEDND